MSSHEGPRSARVIIERNGVRYRVCTLSWSTKDASLFVAPFSHASDYFGGAHPMAAGETAIQIQFTSGGSLTKSPKLSVHESGQLHVKAPDGRIIGGPIHLSHLRGWRGQQVVTVAIDHLDQLPHHQGSLKTSGRSQDIPLGVPDGSARIAIYLNSAEQSFDDPAQATIGLSRGSLSATLWIGLTAFPTEVLAEGSAAVSIIAGVDPTNPAAEGHLLYVRAQGSKGVEERR